MSEIFTLADAEKEYDSTKNVKVKIVETKEPVVATLESSIQEIEETLILLNIRKQQATDAFNKEIKINQDRLTAMAPIVAVAKIVEPVKEPIVEPTGNPI